MYGHYPFFYTSLFIIFSASGYIPVWNNQYGAETIENNAAYIKSWIRTFKDDPKVLVLAAAQTQKAIDYILMHQSDGQP